MGLLIIGFLAVFINGAQSGKDRGTAEKPINNKNLQVAGAEEGKLPLKGIEKQAKSQDQKSASNGQNSEQSQAAAQSQVPNQTAADILNPGEAEDFVKWWVTGAMDFNAETAIKNRKKAMAWMTDEAASIFEQSFWTDELKNGVTQGTIVASFQPVSVHATAVNPDGSVVVHVKGSVAMQVHGQQPSTEHLLTDYLVVKKAKGLRIAAVDSKTYVQANNTHYYY